MMRSLYAGVAGLTTHQTRMDVIGSNIANVNTVAYKSQTVNFSDLMYQTVQKASGANEKTGGVNPKQIGLGVKVAGFNNTILQQGAAQNTGNPYDLMISGSSFFAVSNGNETLYTRDGAFSVDATGNLVMSGNGYNVMGWVAQEDENGVVSIDYNSNLKKLQIMSSENLTCEPVSTSQALCSGNIDSTDLNINSEEGKVVNLNFYDNMGYRHTAKFNLTKLEDNKFNLKLSQIDNELGMPLSDEDFEHVSFGENKEITIEFDTSTGKVIGNGLAEIKFDREYEKLDSYGLVSNDENNGLLTIDYSTLTNFNTQGTSTINMASGDKEGFNAGCSTGEMIGTSISNNGQIYANYSNGLTKLLGQIATARFSNASGLLREGDNLYSQSLNSGEAVLEDVTASGGYMQTGVLEMSNVDLSKEFTDMIVTQRGFQANSRIITVSDTLLEELTNLKR